MAIRSFLAAASYECRMQAGRRAVWLAIGVGAALALGATLGAEHDPRFGSAGRTAAFMIGNLFLLPVVFVALVCDRPRRERRLGVDELLDGAPAGMGPLLWGKFAGATAATASLTLVAYALDTALVSLAWPDVASALPVLPVAFAVIVLPGLVFIAGLSMLLSEWLPVSMVTVLFTVYWVWGDVAPPDQVGPTTSCTALAPVGRFASLAFFGQPTFTVDHDDCYRLGLHAVSGIQGVESVSLLAGLGLLSVLLLQLYRSWRASAR